MGIAAPPGLAISARRSGTPVSSRFRLATVRLARSGAAYGAGDRTPHLFSMWNSGTLEKAADPARSSRS